MKYPLLLFLTFCFFNPNIYGSEQKVGKLASNTNNENILANEVKQLDFQINELIDKIRHDKGSGLLNKNELIRCLVNGVFFNSISLYPLAVLNIHVKNLTDDKQILSRTLRESDLIVDNNPDQLCLILPQTLDIKTVAKKIFDACSDSLFINGRICYSENDLNQWEMDQLEESDKHGSYKYYIDQDPSLSILFIDIDHFKDHYIDGDSLLIQISQLYRKNFRQCNDKIFRFGGDEIVIVLPRVHPSIAKLHVGERLADIVENHNFNTKSGNSIKLTVSIGVSGIEGIPDDLGISLLIAADQGVYEAKRSKKMDALLSLLTQRQLLQLENQVKKLEIS
ncbi:MAG: GGDEF domain-containing protein [Oligoflexales bacterium]